ncbi:MAG: molybdopterin-dependent oxidoreductase [Chloroflexi bacterium]|nr:molybdopterin-dependent oxidoreductase [Chloroflexota bacterium]
MKLSRRNFLAWAGIAATGAIACNLFDDELRVQSPALIPEDLVSGRDNWYATYDGSTPGGQGVLVRVMEGRAKKVRGNPRFPTNQGKQSPAADAMLQSLYHPDRIAGPMLRNGPRGSGRFRPVTWEEALNRFNAAVDANGSRMLLLTDDRCASFARICGAFADAFGGRHVAFGGAADDAAYRAAVQDVMGSGNLPYHDIAHAHTLVSFGSDFLSTWGSPTAYSVGYGKFRSGEYTHHRGTHIHFGARYSMTAANADKWVPITPGAEGYAAMAVAWGIADSHPESSYVQAITGEDGPGALSQFTPDANAGILQIPDAVLDGKSLNEFFHDLAHDYAAHHGLAIGGGGEAAAYSNGKFNASAVLMLNYIMGNVGHEGGLLPNPDGPISSPGPVPLVSLDEWRLIAGDIANGATGLVIINSADPVHGLPAGVGMADALRNENVAIISASPFIDDTSVMADLLIPDRVALEDWGDDTPNPAPGYQVYAVQQPVVNPLPDLDPRSFPDVLINAAAALGRADAMPAESYEGTIRANVEETLGADLTETLKNGGWWDEGATAHGASPSGNLLNDVVSMAAPAQMHGSGNFQLLPFAHNTVLDGRNAHLPWAQNAPDPITTVAWQTWVEINEKQARDMGLREGDVVNITTSSGTIQALAYLNPGMPPDIAAVPMGGGRTAGSEFATGRDSRESSNVVSILAVAGNDAGGVTWSGNRCTITPTGDSMAVSKLEGGYTSREIGEHPAEQVFKTVSGEGGGH